MDKIKSAIIETIELVAKQQGIAVDKDMLTPEALISSFGVDSIGLAILVAHLEVRLGTDPFSAKANIALPKTIGDIVSLYVFHSAEQLG